jgi:uncharacterized cofD-like protein
MPNLNMVKSGPVVSLNANRGLRVVAIGGGTGLSTLLKGLKRYVLSQHVHSSEPLQGAEGFPAIEELTAVVTVTDDGGSSGRLREELKILPPGDIRNCLVALSEDEALLSKLFRYRFAAGEGLVGHSFGNLFLAALTDITRDFAEAVELSSAILATRGRIFPATTSNVRLVAHMDDGSVVHGETKITASSRRIVQLRLVPADAQALPQALEAIAQADLITIGPGSLFTSLVTNLLVDGIPQAIAASPAVKILVCNLMTQANESLGLTASDHLRMLAQHAGRKLFDYALVNRAPLSKELQAKYALEGATPIVVDATEMERLDVNVVEGNYLEEEEEVARHASDRIARDLLRIVTDHGKKARQINRLSAGT